VVAQTAGRSSGSLIALGDEHLRLGGLLVEQRCELLIGRLAAVPRQRIADLLIVQISEPGYRNSVSLLYPDACRA
jgi:hypothetical protein